MILTAEETEKQKNEVTCQVTQFVCGKDRMRMQAFKSSGPFSCLLRDLRLCDPKGFDSSIVRVYFSKILRPRANSVILSTYDAALCFGDPVCSCSVIKLDLVKNHWLVLIC